MRKGPREKAKRKDAQSDIIACLAENNPLNMWQIKKQTNLYYSSVHKAIKAFLLRRIIQPVKSVASQKNVKTILYSLTFKGFILYLSRLELSDITPPASFEMTKQQIKGRYRIETTKLSKETKKLLETLE